MPFPHRVGICGCRRIKSAKMAQEASLSAHASTETSRNQAEAVRTNFARTLKSGQSFRPSNWTLNQGMGNLKIVGKLCGVFTCLGPTPFWLTAFLKMAACVTEWDSDPWLCREHCRSESQISMLVCSNLSEGFHDSLGVGKHWAVLKTNIGLTEQPATILGKMLTKFHI